MYSQPRIRSFLAGADLQLLQNCFVKFGADSKHVVKCGANERAIGILMNAPDVDEEAEVALPGGGGLLKVSEAVALGKLLTSTTDGVGEVADAAGEWVGAIAHEVGAANDLIPVEVIQMQAYASDA